MQIPDQRALSAIGLTAPVAVGYVPLGLVFGLLFVQAGGAPWLAVLSSVIVFAGAAQFMMVPMLAAGLPVSAILFATLVINLRHVFYGLPLALAVSSYAGRKGGPVLVAVPDGYAARSLRDDINQLGSVTAELFPDWEILPYDLYSPHPDLISRRLDLLARLPGMN
ncbi:MAG TPA: AzlC family ABC transporter permease, partial [Halomonas sp.]|nr:AzlC family ABC transporter permease [Halomonas sp.]